MCDMESGEVILIIIISLVFSTTVVSVIKMRGGDYVRRQFFNTDLNHRRFLDIREKL